VHKHTKPVVVAVMPGKGNGTHSMFNEAESSPNLTQNHHFLTSHGHLMNLMWF